MQLDDKSRHWATPGPLLVLMLIAALAASATGCIPDEEPGPETPTVVVDPRLEKTIPVDGMIVTSDAVSKVLSPDGRFLLAARTGVSDSDMLLIPIIGDTPEPILVDSVSKEWLEDTWFDYRPLEWLSSTEFLYAKMGWQPSGAHKGERGSCIVLGTITEDGSGEKPEVILEELAFVPLSYYDSSLQIRVIAEKNAIYMNNNTAMWQFDISERTLSVLKDDVPDYLCCSECALRNI